MGEVAAITMRAMTSLSEMIAKLDVHILALVLRRALARQRKCRAWFLGIHVLSKIENLENRRLFVEEAVELHCI